MQALDKNRSTTLWVRYWFWATMILVLSGCRGPQAEVHWGTRADRPVRLVAVPPSCASSDVPCEDADLSGVFGIVASELEFAGYSIIDAEKLVADARTREDVQVELRTFGDRVASLTARAQVGAVFADLSPSARGALLSEARADGIVTTQVNLGTVGRYATVSRTRTHQVQVRAALGDGAETLWITRCQATSGVGVSIGQALDEAARCAIKGVLR